MTAVLFFLHILPVVAGFLLLGIRPSRGLRSGLVLPVFALSFIASVWVGIKGFLPVRFTLLEGWVLSLGLNRLSALVLVFVNLSGALVALYSVGYRGLKESRAYFSYLCWLVAFANLVCLSQDFVFLVFSWGATLVLLYALLSIGSGASADKALKIVGFGDFALMLGIALYIVLSGSAAMPEGGRVPLQGPLPWVSFLLMLAGAFAKAGCGPLHTWIPYASESAPAPVMAVAPASLDKLLGIYLLARICVDFFVLNTAALILLLLAGSLTIIFAVMMALVQHDLRKLLSYHAISQVGYMVLGFGTGSPLGVAGAIFHMINHSLYKSGLFLTCGAVGQQRRTFELRELGGLAAYMPLTFFAGLVCAFSISGIPPLNGFSSKWMLYQGVLVGLMNSVHKGLTLASVFALLAAMFGSVLTLASFIKLIHAVFLGQPGDDRSPVGEVPPAMWLPAIALSLVCVALGLMPTCFVRSFIAPYTGEPGLSWANWNSVLAALLLVSGFILGVALWGSLRGKKVREDAMFIGGEVLPQEPRFPATEFYKTVEETPFVNGAYALIKSEAIDFHRLLGGAMAATGYFLYIFGDRLFDALVGACGYAVLGVSWVFRKLHTGALDLYLSWSLLGLAALLAVMMRG